ncbi:transposase [Polaribacter sp. IC073]|uniref:transposase n=1 Tax=Polaribacter sp. IC073 TaxID=2508540 RepID=UPI0011BE4C45|nr:transposase [Polaribacter sp. IC073]TXD47769.1 transposase [Polaribacter sp. IC073]
MRQTQFKSFNSISRRIYLNILNYFGNGGTDTSAEYFNAKMKAFKVQFRGVKNIEFFLFRLTNVFA